MRTFTIRLANMAIKGITHFEATTIVNQSVADFTTRVVQAMNDIGNTTAFTPDMVYMTITSGRAVTNITTETYRNMQEYTQCLVESGFVIDVHLRVLMGGMGKRGREDKKTCDDREMRFKDLVKQAEIKLMGIRSDPLMIANPSITQAVDGLMTWTAAVKQNPASFLDDRIKQLTVKQLEFLSKNSTVRNFNQLMRCLRSSIMGDLMESMRQVEATAKDIAEIAYIITEASYTSQYMGDNGRFRQEPMTDQFPHPCGNLCGGQFPHPCGNSYGDQFPHPCWNSYGDQFPHPCWNSYGDQFPHPCGNLCGGRFPHPCGNANVSGETRIL
jgi:hypothetical protein